MDAGPTIETPEGEAPLTWQEIRAWSEQTGIPLTLSESRAMMTLSREWLNWRHLGRDMMQEAPWSADG